MALFFTIHARIALSPAALAHNAQTTKLLGALIQTLMILITLLYNSFGGC
jgi:hypothetical protein